MKNMDKDEVQKFEALSSKWWDPEGPFKPLHEINVLRMEFINHELKFSGLKDLNALDIGCGGGILTESLARAGARVTGIDASEGAISVAKDHAKGNELKIDYIHSTAENFIPSEPFDVVTCMELLEHVPDPLSVVKECTRLVRPNGYVFFSTLNRNIKSFLFGIIGAEYILNLVPKGTHTYSKFIRPSELQKMASEADLSFQSITGMTYMPFFKVCQLSDDVGINYLVCCQKTT